MGAPRRGVRDSDAGPPHRLAALSRQAAREDPRRLVTRRRRTDQRQRVGEHRALRPGRRARDRPTPHHPQRSRGRRAHLRVQLLRHRRVPPPRLPVAVLGRGAEGGGDPAVGRAAVARARGAGRRRVQRTRDRRAAAQDHRGRRQEPAQPRRLVGVGAHAGCGRARPQRSRFARRNRQHAAPAPALPPRLPAPPLARHALHGLPRARVRGGPPGRVEEGRTHRRHATCLGCGRDRTSSCLSTTASASGPRPRATSSR